MTAGAEILVDQGLCGDQVVVADMAVMEHGRSEAEEISVSDMSFAANGGVARKETMIANRRVMTDRGVRPKDIVVSDLCTGLDNCAWHHDIVCP